ncbi:biotin synthase BioB [Thalassoglobus polymorphus]|uniref:Biotin synthase n=1 Tax=Thalassoglobus polymorphus TaxID=2527994 RepID=A0A517QP65_9PLAN|nr:biotin synthase BioB [Thalassoglobus polymorphus]QDT33405.1 Biotin synthase [Thalassoglobus polymorphus]
MIPVESPLTSRWQELSQQVLSGSPLTREQGLEILQSSDAELLELLAATYTVRRNYFGNTVQMYYLKNAKSGLCPEDCGYCSQSIVSDAPIEKYTIANERVLLEGAQKAAETQARTYCIVASGRGPTDREVDHVCDVVQKIKNEHGLHICACLGLLKPDQAQRLADAGVDRINHNLNTSRRYYEEICTTHTYQDRIDTLKIAQSAGMELCSGLIAGMGETEEDLIDAVFELQSLDVKSIPVNFLHSIDGTPLENREDLNPRQCLRIVCLLRLAHPDKEIRIAGGREVNLRSMQAMGLYAANSMFVSDYLTTKGQTPEQDFEMVKDLGFEVVIGGHEMSA